MTAFLKAFSTVIVRLLLFFYLSSTFLSATHIHNEAQEHHSDCKVCIVVKNLQSGDVPSVDELSTNFFIAYELIIEQDSLLSFELHKGYHSQAPTSFLLISKLI